jgi:hypothetical protein
MRVRLQRQPRQVKACMIRHISTTPQSAGLELEEFPHAHPGLRGWAATA